MSRTAVSFLASAPRFSEGELNGERWLFKPAGVARSRAAALLQFSVWLGLALFVTLHHVVWRDEVRALSLALRGDDVFAMFGAIHGEGHPALWYLLLRGAHALVASPAVLQVVSLLVASAAALLLALRSPFSLPLIAMLLFSHFALFEYSAMARNYGISMLLLFVLAMLYERHRDRGVALGVVLLLLANCNVHSVILAGAFLLFWFVDIATSENVPHRPEAFRAFLLNAAIATAGVALCLFTVFPPINDAAMSRPEAIAPKLLFQYVFLPADQLRSLIPAVLGPVTTVSPFGTVYNALWSGVGSLIMVGSTLGLVRRPGAFFAALAALTAFSLFFGLVYPGHYRHAALWLVFLISMYWIVGPKTEPRQAASSARSKPLDRISTVGAALFLLIAALQIPGGIGDVAAAAGTAPPFSRSRDLARFIGQRGGIRDAVIIADPDYLVEPLPYYISNRTYLMRERKFGDVVTFTRKARLTLSLDDILDNARRLHQETSRPILILLAARLERSLPARTFSEGYDWKLTSTPAQVRAFQASTERIAGFAPSLSDESFDVYLLKST